MQDFDAGNWLDIRCCVLLKKVKKSVDKKHKKAKLSLKLVALSSSYYSGGNMRKYGTMTKIAVFLGIISVFLPLTGFGAMADDSLTNGLVAYYPFSGNANDASGYGNHGTPYYTTLTTDRLGQPDSAYDFNGNNSYINIGHKPVLTGVTPTGLSISAWIYSTATLNTSGDIRQVVGQRTNGNGYGLEYGYWYESGSEYGYYLALAFFEGVSGYVNYEILPNRWYHLAGVFDNQQVRIYVNGEQKLPVIDPGWTGYRINTNADTMIGRKGNFYRPDYHEGILDEVRIYNRALTSNEVWRLYDSASIPSAPTGVAASDGTYSNKVRVTWNAADNAIGYQLWRNSTTDTNSASLLSATTATSYDDPSVVANVIYYYWAKATNANGTSGFSASDSGYCVTPSPPSDLPVPYNVQASDGAYTDKVVVTWSSVTDASSYEVWRATSNNTSAASNLTATASTNYDDTSAAGGVTYYYWVKAKSLTTVSAFSDPDSGYAALSTDTISGYANLAATEAILLPNTLAVGEYPGAVGLQVYNWGPADITAPNTRMTLDFYLSRNTTFGDSDDMWLGDYTTDLTLPAGYAVRVAVTSSERTGFRVPAGAVGINYVFGRVRHASPSTLVDADLSDNYALRSGTITVTGSETATPGYYVFNDYDGDGKSDLALYQEASGEWIILLSGSGYETSTAVLGGSGHRPALADYDGDGKSDLAVYHQASGQWEFMLSTEDYAISTLVMGGPGYVPVPADFDGDGLADPIVYQESSGLWQIRPSASNYEPLSVSLGGNGYKAVAADFDGDGLSDLAVYRRSTGDWRIMLSSLEYWTVEFGFGGSGYVPVPADYDGDGKTDPAIYKDSSGQWSVMLSKFSYITATATFGGHGYVAVPADYDGDGKGDVVVYSESARELRILLSGSGYEETVVTIGGPGYEPVGYYDW